MTLLQVRHYRDRICDTLFKNTPFLKIMRCWPAGQFIQWRWGSLVTVCKGLLDREQALRGNWSLKVLLRVPDVEGQSDVAEEMAFKRAKLQASELFQAADRAVTDRMFWSYVKMLYCINGHLEKISSWCEACACHGWESKSCPLKGRRCNELADGTFHHFIQSCDKQAREDFLSCQAGLSPDQVALLQQEFHTATDLILTEARLKTAHWEVLPWKLCGLAADSEVAARAVANLVSV